MMYRAMLLMMLVGAYVTGECPCDSDCEWDFSSDYIDQGEVDFWSQPFFCTNECCFPVWLEWLPGDPQLMRPFLADPRQVNYSGGWRFNDKALVHNVIPVSYGEAIPLLRLYNLWPWCGILQLELEGAVWAVFDPLHDSSPLMNADYYIGVPLTYAIPNWRFRLRGYHISSHIGDEFLLNHPHFRRLNPSAEYLDFFISHNLTREIRLYAGVGCILHADESFPMKRFYAEAGGEVHMYGLGFRDECGDIYGDPYFAVYLRHRGENKHHVDMTYALGYEFGKISTRAKLLRAFLEYHDGNSLEGQFSRCPTHYFAIRVSYGF